MALYKITIEQLTPDDNDNYNRYKEETLYEQKVEGDDTIIEKVMTTVLMYIGNFSKPNITKKENK